MQGLYDLNNDDGDIAFELECDEATTDIKRTCTDDGETDCDDADEVKGVYGRIGNVYDMRTFSPMSHRIDIDVVSEELSGSSIDITLNMDCTNLKRCPNDCSARGACNPDFGVCSCQPSDFHHYTSVFYGSACEYKHCPNDCSGTGSCNRISGECTCWDRYYDAEDPRNASTISSEGTAHFPCRKVICDDGPHPRSLIPVRERSFHCLSLSIHCISLLFRCLSAVPKMVRRSEQDRPNLDAMQCGECAFADNSTQCAPVDFMSPTAMLALELDWDAIVVRNSFLRNNDSAYADMYDSSSPAAQEATQAIADEVNAVLSPLSLTAGLADITITCHICESGEKKTPPFCCSTAAVPSKTMPFLAFCRVGRLVVHDPRGPAIPSGLPPRSAEDWRLGCRGLLHHRRGAGAGGRWVRAGLGSAQHDGGRG